MLSAAYLISAIDRQALALLVEPIKADLSLSDTEIGLLQGVAFMLIYATAAIPAGLLVDRVHRLRLISGAMAMWSLFTGLCGVVQSFWGLFAARSGVGIGESALTPASYSLLTERFESRVHSRVLGLYHCGAAIGAGIAYILCGWLYSYFEAGAPIASQIFGPIAPWRATFIALALPGILLALVLLLLPDHRKVQERQRSSRAEVRSFYAANARLLSFHHLAVAVSNIAIGATSAWTAVFFIRTFDLPIHEAGFLLGIAATLGGLAGLIGGGFLSDMLFVRGPHNRLIMCIGAGAVGIFSSILLYQADSAEFGAVQFGIVIMCSATHINTSAAALQYITPAPIRGTVSAVFFFAISIVGSLGAPLAAILSDGAITGTASIGAAMSYLIPACFGVSGLLFLACYRLYPRVSVASPGAP